MIDIHFPVVAISNPRVVLSTESKADMMPKNTMVGLRYVSENKYLIDKAPTGAKPRLVLRDLFQFVLLICGEQQTQ